MAQPVVIHTMYLREGDRVRFVAPAPAEYIGQLATVIRLGVSNRRGASWTAAVVVRLDGSGVEKWAHGDVFELLWRGSVKE